MRTCFRVPLLGGICLVGALLLAACDKAPPPVKGATPTIGLFLYKANDTYISMVSSTLRSLLADAGTMVVYDAKGDQLTQIDQLEMMLEKKADILIVNIVDPKAAAHLVVKAQQADVPIIFFNREPDLTILQTYAKAGFVGTAILDAGIMQGDIISALWAKHPEYDRNKDGKLQYIMFQGDPDNPEALARTEYSVKQARAKGVNMQPLDGTFVCGWDEELARQAMTSAFVARGPEIEMIIANNDSMALGAIAALAAHGYNTEGGPPEKFIPVIGVDATDGAVAAIKKGVMSATVKQDSQAMAEAISKLAVNALKGKKFLDGTAYTWDALGVSIRIPYTPYMQP